VKWGPWRVASVWFPGTKFINVGTDVRKVRFAEVRP